VNNSRLAEFNLPTLIRGADCAHNRRVHTMEIEEQGRRLPIEDHCAAKLKVLRRNRGLTLEECEIASDGKFKAVVLGSYERGTRAISLSKISQLADFYEVPIAFFFSSENISNEGRWIFDLRRLKERNDGNFPLNFISNSLARIAELRADWEGEVLSIRESDRLSFEIVLGAGREDHIARMKTMQIIIDKPTALQNP
jgi:transcriptional regulator with XRE-family HTH domain